MTGWDPAHWDGGEAAAAPDLPEEPYDLLGGPADLPGDPADQAADPPVGAGPAERPGPLDEPADLPAESPVEWTSEPDAPAADRSAAEPGDPVADRSGESPDDGTDPAGWAADGPGPDPFPPALDLDVQPSGGGPWTDPDLLGGAEPGQAAWTPPTDGPAALRPDLAAAHGDPDASWQSLRSSDDPAVRALARRWTT